MLINPLITTYLKMRHSDPTRRWYPDRGWEITRLLVNKAKSDEALGFVAAGPLEDLLKKHGPAIIDRVEEASQQNVRLQSALSGVWIRPENPIFERWCALMRKYGFADGKRTPL